MDAREIPAKAELSPREEKLLDELKQLSELVEKTTQQLATANLALGAREKDLKALRSSEVTLRQENQHLREVIQTWRQRLDSVLVQLKDLN